jgi:hypothetical protein
MSETKFTPGPWRWEFNRQHKSVYLVGGVPTFDKTVMQFHRWGMYGAVPAFNDKITGNVWNIMERLCDKPEWLSPFEGREHHIKWCSNVVHPDACLIAAAPDMYAELEAAMNVFRFYQGHHAAKGHSEKEQTNKQYADRIAKVLEKARGEG